MEIYNLQGDFEGKKSEEWKPGTRAEVSKPKENLKPEGDFVRREKAEFAAGEKASVVRREDNLKVAEGKLEVHRQEWATSGDRAQIVQR